MLLPGTESTSKEVGDDVSAMLSTTTRAAFTGAAASLDAQRSGGGERQRLGQVDLPSVDADTLVQADRAVVEIRAGEPVAALVRDDIARRISRPDVDGLHVHAGGDQVLPRAQRDVVDECVGAGYVDVGRADLPIPIDVARAGRSGRAGRAGRALRAGRAY